MNGLASHPRVLTLRHPSRSLARPAKRCLMVVPDGADDGVPLPICYFLHGWGGTAESFLSHPEIAAQVLAAPWVSAFPESFRRWLINDHQGLRYEDYFVGELISAVEARIGRPIDGARRALAGFSMGGAAAFLLAARHPGLFSAVACHAGAFDAPRREGDPYAALGAARPEFMPTEAEHDAVWGPPGSATRQEYDPYRYLSPGLAPAAALYLDVGAGDHDRMLAMNRAFHQALKTAGIAHHYEERPGGHDMDYVAGALPGSFAFLSQAFAAGAA